MSGVFLSYSRGDRALADQIIRGLRGLGVEVWWDEDMPGVNWQQELERQIKELAAVVVLWTANSEASNNVRDEARLGLSTDKLVNVLVGVAQPPFPYDRVNGLPLDGWTGREPHGGWTRLVQTLDALVAQGGGKPGAVLAALAARERDVRETQSAVGGAQQAFQDAQTREGAAAEAAVAANEALDRADEQHQRVVEMRGSPALLHTAQQELETARGARDEAMAAHHAAKGDLSESARRLSRAKADFEAMFDHAGEPPALVTPPPEPVPAPRPTPIPDWNPPPREEPAVQAAPTPPPAAKPVPPPPAHDGAPTSGLNRLIALLFGYQGRIGRRSFWLFLFAYEIAVLLVLLLTRVLSPRESLGQLVGLTLTLLIAYPAFPVVAKRAHDLGRGMALAFVLLLAPLPFAFLGYSLAWPLLPVSLLPNPVTVIALLASMQEGGDQGEGGLVAALAINAVALMAFGGMAGAPDANRFGPAPGAKSGSRA